MLSKKYQLKTGEIPHRVGMSLVIFFQTLFKLDLCSWQGSLPKRGLVIHFCKRNYRSGLGGK